MLGAGVEGTKSLDDAKIAEYIHANEIDTVVGPVRFNEQGEWATSRMLFVQYKGLKEGHAMEMFGKPGARQILYPEKYKTGEWQPYAAAR